LFNQILLQKMLICSVPLTFSTDEKANNLMISFFKYMFLTLFSYSTNFYFRKSFMQSPRWWKAECRFCHWDCKAGSNKMGWKTGFERMKILHNTATVLKVNCVSYVVVLLIISSRHRLFYCCSKQIH